MKSPGAGLTLLWQLWRSSDSIYNALREWRDTLMAEWESLPKHD